MLILDSSREWYYHIGIPYLDSSLESELLFKEKKSKQKENYYVYGTDSGKFSKKKFWFLYADGAGYYYYEVLCFDQDIFKFIPN